MLSQCTIDCLWHVRLCQWLLIVGHVSLVADYRSGVGGSRSLIDGAANRYGSQPPLSKLYSAWYVRLVPGCHRVSLAHSVLLIMKELLPEFLRLTRATNCGLWPALVLTFATFSNLHRVEGCPATRLVCLHRSRRVHLETNDLLCPREAHHAMDSPSLHHGRGCSRGRCPLVI